VADGTAEQRKTGKTPAETATAAEELAGADAETLEPSPRGVADGSDDASRGSRGVADDSDRDDDVSERSTPDGQGSRDRSFSWMREDDSSTGPSNPSSPAAGTSPAHVDRSRGSQGTALFAFPSQVGGQTSARGSPPSSRRLEAVSEHGSPRTGDPSLANAGAGARGYGARPSREVQPTPGDSRGGGPGEASPPDAVKGGQSSRRGPTLALARSQQEGEGQEQSRKEEGWNRD
jgi:hypothetical protein